MASILSQTNTEPHRHEHNERADGGFLVGIDLGGTKIRAGIADSAGAILAERKVKTETGGSNAVHQIVSIVEDLCAAIGADVSRVAATGIGGAGVPDEAGTSFDLAPNLQDISETPFVRQLSLQLGHPVLIENDVNVAALGELHYGLGRGHSDFVYVAVGTGIGMGIIGGGRLVRGAHGAAGEIGFLPFGADPLDPATRVRGALEEETAGDAIVRRYQQSTGKDCSPRDIFLAAAAGDSSAVATIDTEARWIAAALAAVNAVLDPELVVLGGGIGSRSALQPLIHSWLDRYGVASLDVHLSTLGHHAPVAGAVRVALESAHSLQKGRVR